MKYKYTVLFLILSLNIFSNSLYPEIKQLNIRDNFFKQIVYDTKSYYIASKSDKKFTPLTIYKYKPKNGVSLYQVAASFSLPYSTLATLNRFNSNTYFNGKQTIFIPNQPGIFIVDKPISELEHIIKSGRDKSKGVKIKVNNLIFYYLPEEDFDEMELSYYLDILSIFPVPAGKISSNYGYREDPFTKNKSYHKGVDIAAPINSVVVSPKSGTVISTGINKVYGKYIFIDHGQNNRTFYGHLNNIFVKENQKVVAGETIALVGTSGRSTGPHLHFEFIKSGKNENPLNFINNR